LNTSTTPTGRVRVAAFIHHWKLGRALLFICVLAAVVILIFPILWMVRISITPRPDLFLLPPKWVPKTLNMSGYATLFGAHASFFVYFLNSLVVALGTMILSLVAGTLAGYSFSRFEYPGRKSLMVFTLSAQMFPWALLVISLYLLYSWMHILNSRLGLMLAHTTFALPLTIWILKGYFDTIPRELEESSFLDGCGRIEALWRIILPLTRPGITAAGVYVFLFSWNDFLFGLTLITQDSKRILGPGIALSFIGEFSYRWVEMMSASVIITVPIVLLFLFMQRAFVEGLTAGALKD